ncbi:MAG: hypothetical protein ACO1RA_00600 [Planctomycetaceae bacterium]
MSYYEATPRQKQFIRNLGGKVPSGLTKDEASALIDSLLLDEIDSGKTYPCPYCKVKFGPRPSRDSQCPNCKEKIVSLLGKLYTEEQAKAAANKEWLRECQQDNKTNVREDAKDEREFQQEFDETHLLGYIIRIGPHCNHVRDRNGLMVLLNDALHNPNWLPPYEGCDCDSCECDYEPVSEGQVPPGTRIVVPDAPAATSIKVTRRSQQSNKSTSCAAVALAFLCVALVGMFLVIALFVAVALLGTK